ncbi:MAG: winged helix-turn-helix domain-containing protein [Pyrinomonadaceae bacterium]|nr:winged helix-turn-helix domain-containing protein [Pyrinomonadaceae bacterium]
METIVNTRFCFDEFEVDPTRRVLLKQGQPIPLNPKAFDLLLALIIQRGETVSKNELLDAVWEGSFVEEKNLTVHVAALRKVFGERKDENRFIATVPGKGYKFVAPIVFPNDNGFIIETQKIERITIEEEIEPIRENSLGGWQNSTSSLKKHWFWMLGLLILLVMGGIWYFGRSKQTVFSKPNFQRLTTSGKITNIAASPNGEYFVFSQKEGEGESLFLQQVGTESQIRIMPNRKIEYLSLAISPDNKFIYTSVFFDNNADAPLWKIPLLGGAYQEIPNIVTGADISFSPDGQKFAYSRENDDDTQLVIVNADGTNEKVLLNAKKGERDIPYFEASPFAWSPQGDEIACAVSEKTDEGMKSKILLIDAKSGKEQTLGKKNWENILHLTWIDAENIAFIDGENGQIWRISRTYGEAEKLTNDIQQCNWLVSTKNGLFTVQTNTNSSLQVGVFNENTGAISAQEIYNNSSLIKNIAWTSKGKILFTSGTTAEAEIHQIDADGKNLSALTSDAKIVSEMTVSPITDDIVFSSKRNGKNSLWLADLNGKKIRQLTDGIEDFSPQFSSDGKFIIFQRGRFITPPTVWRLNLADQTEAQISTQNMIFPVISPDGTKIASTFMDLDNDRAWKIGIFSTETGEILQKIELPKGDNQRLIRWHPNGKFLTHFFDVGGKLNFMVAPVFTKDEKIITEIGKGEIQSFDWSQNGKNIVYSVNTQTKDVIKISDFIGQH